MTESKRRASIEKIQARQRRYHAMGRCWCGRDLRRGYKRCAKCMEGHAQRRARYVENGRCYCGNPVTPGTKRNGAPYKSCNRCRERARARYQQRKGSL